MIINSLYIKFIENLLRGNIDLDSGLTIKVLLVNSSYVFNRLHNDLSDISSYEVFGTNYDTGGVTVSYSLRTNLESNTEELVLESAIFENTTISGIRGAIVYISGGSNLLIQYIGAPTSFSTTGDGKPIIIYFRTPILFNISRTDISAVTNILSTSSTSDAVDMQVGRSASTNVASVSATPNLQLVVNRRVSAAIASLSTTSTADMTIVRPGAAVINSTSNTGPFTLTVQKPVSATINSLSATPDNVSLSDGGGVLLSEDWTGTNTTAGLESRGWYDNTRSVGSNLPYQFTSDPAGVFSHPVLNIIWDSTSSPGNPTVAGLSASALRYKLSKSDTTNGSTMHYAFRLKGFYSGASTAGAHLMRFMHDMPSDYTGYPSGGGAGPSWNQLNCEIGGAGETGYARQPGSIGSVSRALYFAGGEYASHTADCDANGYLQDSVWYEVIWYCYPQNTAGGRTTGTSIMYYRPYGVGNWTKISEVTAYSLTGPDVASPTPYNGNYINQLWIGPYKGVVEVNDTRVYLGFVKAYSGNRISTLAVNPTTVVTITAPAAGSTVSSTVSLTASFTGNAAPITSVRFLIDSIDVGGVSGSNLSSPQTINWNSATVTDASHSLVVTATDSYGTVSSSARSFTVANTPAELSDQITTNGRYWRVFFNGNTVLSSLSNNAKIPTNIAPTLVGWYNTTESQRRIYASTAGRNGTKCIKLALTPVGTTNLDGVAESNAPYLQVARSETRIGGNAISSATYDCVEGDELWFRGWLYFSSNWSWVTTPGDSGPKLIRLYGTRNYNGEVIISSSNTTDGSVYLQTQGFANGNFEMYGGTGGQLYGIGGSEYSGPKTYWPVGRWFRLDTYMKISSNSNLACLRLWIDGDLVLARYGSAAPYSGRQTLTPAGTSLRTTNPGFTTMSTWEVNNPALPNGQQYMLYDDMLLTNDASYVNTYGIVDAYGNKLIGGA